MKENENNFLRLIKACCGESYHSTSPSAGRACRFVVPDTGSETDQINVQVTISSSVCLSCDTLELSQSVNEKKKKKYIRQFYKNIFFFSFSL